MTLPQPNKPSVSDTIKNIVGYTKENQDYIEANYNKQVVLQFTRTASDASETVEIGGAGFQPSAVIFFAPAASTIAL